MLRYLLVVDDSPEAEAAARWLGETCRGAAEAEVVVLHVFDADRYYARVRRDGGEPEPLDLAMQGAADEVFSRVLPILGMPARTLVRIGRPDAVIPQMAERVQASTIVVGHAARTALRRLLHRGLSERLERGAPCPVVAVAA